MYDFFQSCEYTSHISPSRGTVVILLALLIFSKNITFSNSPNSTRKPSYCTKIKMESVVSTLLTIGIGLLPMSWKEYFFLFFSLILQVFPLSEANPYASMDDLESSLTDGSTSSFLQRNSVNTLNSLSSSSRLSTSHLRRQNDSMASDSVVIDMELDPKLQSLSLFFFFMLSMLNLVLNVFYCLCYY